MTNPKAKKERLIIIAAVEKLVDFCKAKAEDYLWPGGPTGEVYLDGLVRVKPDGSNRGSFVRGLDDLNKTVNFLKEVNFSRVEVSPEIQFGNCQYYQASLPEGFRALTGILTLAECREKGVEVEVSSSGNHGEELVASQSQELLETHVVSAIVDEDGMLSTWYPGRFTAANPDPDHKLPADPAKWQDEWAVKIQPE